jgi:hypothetical protein
MMSKNNSFNGYIYVLFISRDNQNDFDKINPDEV